MTSRTENCDPIFAQLSELRECEGFQCEDTFSDNYVALQRNLTELQLPLQEYDDGINNGQEGAADFSDVHVDFIQRQEEQEEEVSQITPQWEFLDEFDDETAAHFPQVLDDRVQRWKEEDRSNAGEEIGDLTRQVLSEPQEFDYGFSSAQEVAANFSDLEFDFRDRGFYFIKRPEEIEDLSRPVLSEREFVEGISSGQREEGEDEETEDFIRQVLVEQEPDEGNSRPGQEIASDYTESLHLDFMQTQNDAENRRNGGEEIGDLEVRPSNNENDQFFRELFATVDSFWGCYSRDLYYSGESPPQVTEPDGNIGHDLTELDAGNVIITPISEQILGNIELESDRNIEEGSTSGFCEKVPEIYLYCDKVLTESNSKDLEEVSEIYLYCDEVLTDSNSKDVEESDVTPICAIDGPKHHQTFCIQR